MSNKLLQIKLRLRTVLLMASVLFLGACTRTTDFQDLQAFIDDIQSRPGAEVEPVPEFVPYEAFIYGAASLRSPFEVPLQIDPNTNIVLNQDIEPDFDRPRERLESQALSELTMVGVLERGGIYAALVEDGFGEIHRVAIGNYMGRNYGRIEFISSTQISVRTIVPSGSGGWVERPQSLALQ